MSTKKTDKKNPKNYCEICDFSCSCMYDLARHNNSKKHQKKTFQFMLTKYGLSQDILSLSTEKYKCQNCGKAYDKYNSYWYHLKRNCKEKQNQSNDDVDTNQEIFNRCDVKEEKVDIPKEEKQRIDEKYNAYDMIMELVAKNTELTNAVLETNKNYQKILENQTNTFNNTINGNINTVNNNQKFNLNFFLNEECKDAINITEYIETIKLTLKDLEETARLGYTDGITKIINDRVRETGLTKRPFHCTDQKREVVYVKDNNVWEKENSDKPRMKSMISNVIHKNLQQLSTWKETYPECTDLKNKKGEEFLNIMIQANGGQQTEREKKEEKILKNILKEVSLEKMV